MLHLKSVSHLRCPDNHSPLTLASDAQIREINNLIRAGQAVTHGGRRVSEPIAAALVRAGGDVIYPITHGIPLLLRDEGIPIKFENQ
jgi:uncharacterized protein YbaR (Trm112 family)